MKSFSVTIFNKPELIYLHIINWFQVFLSNSNGFICTQLNGFKYCYLTLVILFNIINSFACIYS